MEKVLMNGVNIIEELRKGLVRERKWNCVAQFSEFGTRKELEARLRINEGDFIREVEVSCDVEDDLWPERKDTYIICGDSLDSIKEKAVKLFCGIYVNLLCEVAHSDITVVTLTEQELDDDLDFEELEFTL